MLISLFLIARCNINICGNKTRVWVGAHQHTNQSAQAQGYNYNFTQQKLLQAHFKLYLCYMYIQHSSRATSNQSVHAQSPVLALRVLSMQCPRMYSKWFLRDLNLNDSVVVCGARVSVWSGSVILCYRHPAFSVTITTPRHPVCILTYHLSQSLLSPIHPVAVLSSIFSSLYCRSPNTLHS